MARITLDLNTNDIIVPDNYFIKIAAENEIIKRAGSDNLVDPVKRIRDSFEAALADTDNHLLTKSAATAKKNLKK